LGDQGPATRDILVGKISLGEEREKKNVEERYEKGYILPLSIREKNFHRSKELKAGKKPGKRGSHPRVDCTLRGGKELAGSAGLRTGVSLEERWREVSVSGGEGGDEHLSNDLVY